MRQLQRKYSESGDAEIVIVYQKEPHAGQLAFKDIEQPESFEARCALAKRMQEEYELPMILLVDTMEDQSRALFSDLPSPAFVIDAQGIVRAKFPWADAETIGPAVENLPKKSSGIASVGWLAIVLLTGVFLLFGAVALSLLRNAPARKKSGEDKVGKSPTHAV